VDQRRTIRIAAEIQADLHNHDLYSRQTAREAIEKYNRHVEQCNRAIENAESGQDRPGWSDSPVEGLRAELRRVVAQLDATTQDRNKLQEELQQKSLVVTDLSTRLDALSRKINGPSSSEPLPRDNANTEASGNGAKFVGHINRLQEELYSERQKNKRLKGA
jgi:chromosome segregation ATPase